MRACSKFVSACSTTSTHHTIRPLQRQATEVGMGEGSLHLNTAAAGTIMATTALLRCRLRTIPAFTLLLSWSASWMCAQCGVSGAVTQELSGSLSKWESGRDQGSTVGNAFGEHLWFGVNRSPNSGMQGGGGGHQQSQSGGSQSGQTYFNPFSGPAPQSRPGSGQQGSGSTTQNPLW